jgi:hypothetical protein
MDKKFLDKVLDQIVSETKIIDNRVYTPFYPSSLSFSPVTSSFYFFSFSNHCKDVYGLNEEEIDYVWEEYKHVIKYKKDNGL